MESDESAGGAADSCPAGRTKRHLAPSLAAGRRPFINSPFTNSLARRGIAMPVSMRCGRSSARHACASKAMPGHARPGAMARNIRNQPAIATRVFVVAPRYCVGTCDESAAGKAAQVDQSPSWLQRNVDDGSRKRCGGCFACS